MNPSDMCPLGTRMIVRKYTKPEKVGSIWINPAWRQDNSRSLWELVFAPEPVAEWFGFVPPPDTILVTPKNHGVYISELSDEQEVFMIDARDVVRVIPWQGGRPVLTTGKALVRLDEPEEQTDTGLIVPATVQGRVETGVVVEIAEGFPVTPGQRVLFTPFVGTEVEAEGQKLLIVREEEVLAVLGEEDE